MKNLVIKRASIAAGAIAATALTTVASSAVTFDNAAFQTEVTDSLAMMGTIALAAGSLVAAGITYNLGFKLWKRFTNKV